MVNQIMVLVIVFISSMNNKAKVKLVMCANIIKTKSILYILRVFPRSLVIYKLYIQHSASWRVNYRRNSVKKALLGLLIQTNGASWVIFQAIGFWTLETK